MLRNVLILLPLLVGGCFVPKKKYDLLAADLASARASLEERERHVTTLEQALADEKGRVADLDAKRLALQKDKVGLEEQLEGFRTETAVLLKDRSRLRASVEQMEQALEELAARKAAAEERVAQFRDLLTRFQPLIDAGRLRVKMVDGRMVVELPTDILFASGRADLSPDGKTALAEVGAVLASIPDREFQIEGHTDDVPIRTERFPSNWELAAARAITVVNTLREAGLPAERLSAASYASYRPTVPNDTPEHREANRRIEIVVVPDLSSLPGSAELEAIAEN